MPALVGPARVAVVLSPNGGVPAAPAGYAYLYQFDANGEKQLLFVTDALGVSRPLLRLIA